MMRSSQESRNDPLPPAAPPPSPTAAVGAPAQTARPTPATAGLAVAALVLSFVGCVPARGLFAAILGLITGPDGHVGH